MKISPGTAALTLTIATLVTVGFAGCAGTQSTKTGAYEVRTEPLALPDLSLKLAPVKPVPPRVMCS